ncbi:MAG: hypothetical protein ACOC8N_01475 [Spirochaetota bacterium]
MSSLVSPDSLPSLPDSEFVVGWAFHPSGVSESISDWYVNFTGEEEMESVSEGDHTDTESRQSQLIDELLDIQNECADNNWDGYDALPISNDVITEAAQFISIIPEGVHKPDVSPSPDGSIIFEWRDMDRKIFTISLFGIGEILYTFLSSSFRDSGTISFKPSLPEKIAAFLTAHFSV